MRASSKFLPVPPRHCLVRLDLTMHNLPRFAAINTKIAGFAQIPAGSKGRCTNSFEFAGSMNLTGISGRANYAIELPGEREGPFDLAASPDLVSSSPCRGSTATVSMSMDCSISPTESRALIAVCYSPW